MVQLAPEGTLSPLRIGDFTTEAGVMMYNTVLQLHNCYASLSNRLKELESANAQRTLRVGVTPTNVRPISRLLFGAFQSRYPDVRIQMTEQRSEETIAMLSNGDVDLIVVPGQHVSFSLFEQLPLYDVQWELF